MASPRVRGSEQRDERAKSSVGQRPQRRAAGGSGRLVLRPRFSTNSSMPLSTASREHAELITPLPPMNNTLRFPMLLR